MGTPQSAAPGSADSTAIDAAAEGAITDTSQGAAPAEGVAQAPGGAATGARVGIHAVHAGAAAALLEPLEASDAESEAWLITYLDVITLLLVMMVVMLAFAGAYNGVGEGSDALARQATEAAPVELPPLPLPAAAPETAVLPDLGEDIEVLVQDRSLSFRISSEILFESGQADLSLGGLALLRRLLPVLRESPHPIAVHGHTDALPIRSARFPSNWELSGARAGSVVRYFEANGVDRQRLRAVGFADTRPLANNASAEGRALNRRVELVLEQPGA